MFTYEVKSLHLYSWSTTNCATSFFTGTQISYTTNQKSLDFRTINLCCRRPHYEKPRLHSSLIWMPASNSFWSASKFLLFIYFSSWVQGYCPSPYGTLWVLHVAPAFQKLPKQAIISFVGCSLGIRLKDLWINDLPQFTEVFLNGRLLWVLWGMASNRQ